MMLTFIRLSFLVLSCLLIFISIDQNIKDIYRQENKKLTKNKTYNVSNKTESKRRKLYVAKCSYFLAQEKIENILLKKSMQFEVNNSDLLRKDILIRIVKIINQLKHEFVLSIFIHTDKAGSSKYNLNLSQQRADKLKEYFQKNTRLPLIVAIGYGEEFSLESGFIKMNLKRIKNDKYND